MDYSMPGFPVLCEPKKNLEELKISGLSTMKHNYEWGKKKKLWKTYKQNKNSM